MEDYIEDYRYNNCFWKKSGQLYNHSDNKFYEYMSIGEIFQKMSNDIYRLSESFGDLKKLYKKPNEPEYTREKGINVIFYTIKMIKNEFLKLSKKIGEIANKILEKKDTYESKNLPTRMCDEAFKKYDDELKKLTNVQKSYFDTMNKVVEIFLNINYGKKGENTKAKTELKNKMKSLEKKKEEYKIEIEKVEGLRAEYMEEQGNIFAVKEEYEKDCTDELKIYFKEYFQIFGSFLKKFEIGEKEMKIIESMNGETDTKSFAESNKSLMTGPKRNMYKEYAVDLNYYMENFEIIKAKLRGKTPKEQREIQHQLSSEITKFLGDLIKEEPDEIHKNIEGIAMKIKDNKLEKNEYNYLIGKFQSRFDDFLKWKEEKVGYQDYRKVGKEWDERFCYMHTFLKYFNKKRVENKELNQENFNYLCNAIKKILELNDNEDIDYNLCDLVVILSSTFYTKDPNSPSGKKYVNEVIRSCPLMQKQGFWVRLTKYELNEEIQKQNKIEETLEENNITEEKLNNSVVAKLMSVSFNIMQFVMDSKLFNRIIFDVFNYCKINEKNRHFVVGMLDSQIQGENLTHLQLDIEVLLTMDKNAGQKKEEVKNEINEEKKEENKEEIKEENKEEKKEENKEEKKEENKEEKKEEIKDDINNEIKEDIKEEKKEEKNDEILDEVKKEIKDE